ncbi:MAG: hypothetical protein IKR57_01710 [Bacilli bacterium]|nr:hypothetical protein [Bacilli bacterium]
MSSFDIYKAALSQYNKAMDYHSAICYNKKLDKRQKMEKNLKERKKQQSEYDKAMFYYKLYKAASKLEESEEKKL